MKFTVAYKMFTVSLWYLEYMCGNFDSGTDSTTEIEGILYVHEGKEEPKC